MRVALIAAPAVMIMAVLGGSASAAGMAKSGSLERTITVTSPHASAIETEIIYWDGDRLRSEKYNVSGSVVQIKDGKALYMFTPGAKEAMKIVVPDKYSRTVQQILAEDAGPVKGGKKVGSGKIAGYACDVYTLSKGAGGARTIAKVYVSKDPRFPIPLRVEMSAGSRSQVIETRNIRLNASISRSLFTLPKGMKIKEQKVGEAPPPKGGHK